jgi:hypothetical protein
MEHRVAEQTHAVERYLLNEFTMEDRADFEAHLFDCPICGERVRQGAIAIDNVKQVFLEEGETSEPRRSTWDWGRAAGWFRLPVLVPTFVAVALAAVVVYQNAKVIPALERPQVLSMDDVIAPLARESAAVVTVDRRRLLKFNINFTADLPRPYGSLVCEFQRANGVPVLSVDCGARQIASFTFAVLLPTRAFPPGQYVMLLRPAAEPHAELQRYSFVIQDRGDTT